jgi:hypothetical protein
MVRTIEFSSVINQVVKKVTTWLMFLLERSSPKEVCMAGQFTKWYGCRQVEENTGSDSQSLACIIQHSLKIVGHTSQYLSGVH